VAHKSRICCALRGSAKIAPRSRQAKRASDHRIGVRIISEFPLVVWVPSVVDVTEVSVMVVDMMAEFVELVISCLEVVTEVVTEAGLVSVVLKSVLVNRLFVVKLVDLEPVVVIVVAVVTIELLRVLVVNVMKELDEGNLVLLVVVLDLELELCVVNFVLVVLVVTAELMLGVVVVPHTSA